jgi:hypothetical protein
VAACIVAIGALSLAPPALANTVQAFGFGSSYKVQVSAGHPAPPSGWEQPGYDDSAWLTQSAPFSSDVGIPNHICPSFPQGVSNFPVNGQVLVRKHFTLPAGASGLQIRGTVDNDADVWINGHLVGSKIDGNCHPNGLDTESGVDGLQAGGGPAEVDDSWLVAGDNVIAIRATDRGVVSFLDLRVEYEAPQVKPTLVRAVPTGSFTTVVGRVEGGGSSAGLSFFSGTTCTDGVIGGTQTALGAANVTLDANGYFSVGVANVAPLTFVAARATTPASSPLSSCVVAKAANDAWPTAFPLDSTGLTTQDVIDSPGQSRWYSFSVQPGSKVTVNLTHLPADYSLALFKDIGQAYTTLTSPQDLTRLSAEYAPSVFSPSVFSPSVFSPSVFSPDAYAPSVFSPSVFSPSVFSPSVFSPSVFSPSVFSPSVFSPSVFSPSVFSPSVFSPSVFSPSVFSPSVFSPAAFASAQTRSLVAVAADPGTADKFVVANTWSNTGNYYVRVTGRNGAFSTDGAFTVSATRGSSGCPATVADIGSAPGPAPAGGFKTVILTDPSRLPGSAAEKATLASKLAAFAARPEVAGVIVALSQNARVVQLNAQADANTACPYAKNLVAAAIKDIVDTYRANNALSYVTIVGGDGTIPFFRYPDESMLGPESGYEPPVGTTTASEASLRTDNVLGQDAYGSKAEISLRSNTFPVPDLAVGRLVETAAEASGLIDAYTATNGVVTPHSSLVTGYDFLADAASSVVADLTAGTAGPGQVDDRLIAPNNISPQDPQAWTAAQLKTKLLGTTRHDLVFLAGHFSANSALAADFSTSLLTTDLASSSTNFQSAVVFSAGCHSGYNIVDADAVPNVTQPLDWAQAFSQKKATLIAGTGYQYGDTDFLEYSERIYASFAKELRYGTGPVAVGNALVRAKQAYLAATPDIRGIHEKALLESTVFGLPMMSVNMPAGRLPAPGSGSVVTALNGFTTDPGQTLGLTSAMVTVNPTFTQHTVTLQNVAGGSPLTATYYSGGAGVQTNPAEPALPLERLDVTPPNPSVVLRGVGFRGGTYADETLVPLTGAPTTELRGVHVPFVSPVFYPMRLATPNYFDALNGGRTNLLVIPAQHKAVDISAGTSTLRRFSSVSLQLFYSGYLQSAALSAAPDITQVGAASDGSGTVTFFAHAAGNPAAGMQQVWVTYTGDGPSRWASLDLTQDPVDSTLWTGTLSGITSPANVRFMVQAVNGLGLVSVEDNLGAYYQVTGATSSQPAAATLQLQSPPASGAFGETKSVTAVLQSGSTGVAGKSVAISIGGSDRVGTTGADGSVTVAVPVNSLPGSTTVTASFAGDGNYEAAGASAPFTITKAATSLSAFTSQPGVRGTILTSTVGGVTQPLLQRTVTFSLTGPTSRISSAITDYLGQATFSTSGLAPGTYNLTATFATDSTYQGSSRTGQLVIAAAAPVYLHGIGAAANPPTLTLDTTAPSGSQEKYRDSADVKFAGGNLWKDLGVWSTAPASSSQTLNAFDVLRIWLGLKNSDDQGTRFDLRAEIYVNDTLIASGTTRCIDGIVRNASQAKETAVGLGSSTPISLNASDRLTVKLSTRIGTKPDGSLCAGHASAVGLRAYFDSTARPARLDPLVGP